MSICAVRCSIFIELKLFFVSQTTGFRAPADRQLVRPKLVGYRVDAGLRPHARAAWRYAGSAASSDPECALHECVGRLARLGVRSTARTEGSMRACRWDTNARSCGRVIWRDDSPTADDAERYRETVAGLWTEATLRRRWTVKVNSHICSV